MRPASYSIPDDIRATLVRLLAYMGGLAALAVAAASFFAAPSDIVAALGSASAQRPAWSTVERPYPAFELLMPELAGSTYNYAIQRRAKDSGRETAIGCHTFRATGITDYLTNGGKLEIAQRMAGHSNAKTTGLYDRRNDDISVGEVERIGI